MFPRARRTGELGAGFARPTRHRRSIYKLAFGRETNSRPRSRATPRTVDGTAESALDAGFPADPGGGDDTASGGPPKSWPVNGGTRLARRSPPRFGARVRSNAAETRHARRVPVGLPDCEVPVGSWTRDGGRNSVYASRRRIYIPV